MSDPNPDPEAIQPIISDTTVSGGVNLETSGDAITAAHNQEPIELLHGSRIPARNPLFVGRDKTLNDIADRLNADGSLLILIGNGGAGKSQTAIEFAHRYVDRFPGGVFWLRCDQPDLISTEVADCGSNGRSSLDEFDELPQPDRVNVVKGEWLKPVARLLIFDTAEDPAILADWRPAIGGCRVLVTARRANWPPTLTPNVFDLPALDRADSIKLLAQGDVARTGSFATDKDADAIADLLVDLPLALQVAGSYIQSYGLTPTQYLTELKAGPVLQHVSLQDWLEDQLPAGHTHYIIETFDQHLTELAQHESLQEWLKDELPTGHTPNIIKTFDLSYQSLARSRAINTAKTDQSLKPTRNLALIVFHLLAHCAPMQPLPRDVLLQATQAKDDKQLIDALRELNNLGLVTLDNQLCPFTHRLLQAYASLRTPEPAADSAIMGTIAIALDDIATNINATGLPKDMQPFLPHLQTLALHAESRYSPTAGSLFSNIGYHLEQTDDYAAARAAFERALAIDEKVFGPNHPNVATIVNNLGRVYHDIGDLPAARAAFERALAIDEKALGQDHPNVARDINSLGMVYRDQRDLSAARAALVRALAIDRQTFDSDHHNVAPHFNNLGLVYQALGDLTAARSAFEHAHAIMEKYASKKPDTRTVRPNVASLLKRIEGR